MTLFVNDLKRLDKTLYLYFDRIINRFVVYRRDRKNVPRKILVIEDNQGQFCRPNREHIDQLYQMDSWANKNIIKEMDAYNENLDKESDERIAQISEERVKQMTRTSFY
jgi:hypothetical protein